MPRTIQSNRKLICSASAQDKKNTPAPTHKYTQMLKGENPVIIFTHVDLNANLGKFIIVATIIVVYYGSVLHSLKEKNLLCFFLN